ncbi:MAG: hypothetical protein BIFFINMI_00886 [Phycisphaerae bacterium]|nr:hypothetical protein [Phycisphaerae bacterium]
MSNVEETIHLLVAPVVMISGCGLLCLALYARMAAVISRARAFNKERLDLLAGLADLPPNGPLFLNHRGRATMLHDQVGLILGRVRLIRASLVLLMATVICMLACSLALGLSLFASKWAAVGLGLFVVGTASEIAGAGLALLELTRALDSVVLEYDRIEATDPPPPTWNAPAVQSNIDYSTR